MWFSRARASDMGDRSPWGDFWFEPVALRSSAGARVSNDTAMRLTAVYRSVRLLSETFASLPFVLYRRKDGGGKELVTDHWVYRLFCKRPNRWQNPFEWREMIQGHLVHRGNAFNRIYANTRGEIDELVPLHPDCVKIELMPTDGYRFRVRNRDGSEEIVPRGEIWHLRGLSSDGLLGLNPIEIARESIGLALAAQDYGARFFANDGRPVGGVIEMEAGFKSDDDQKTFLSSWQNARTGSNRFKTAVLQHGMKFKDIPINNKDAQFLEARQFSVADVARLYGIPPHMIGDLSKSTNNNIEQQSLEFVTYTMTPWAERWEASIEADLMLDGDELEIEFDFANLLRGDSKTRATYYHNGILDGWLTRNEVRIAENKDPLGGLDEPLRPLNMVPDSQAPDEEETAALPVPQDAPVDAMRARAQRLQRAASERVIRKEVAAVEKLHQRHGAADLVFAAEAFYEAHVQYVAEAVLVAPDLAAAWCEAQRNELADAAQREAAGTDGAIAELLGAWKASRAQDLAAIALGAGDHASDMGQLAAALARLAVRPVQVRSETRIEQGAVQVRAGDTQIAQGAIQVTTGATQLSYTMPAYGKTTTKIVEAIRDDQGNLRAKVIEERTNEG